MRHAWAVRWKDDVSEKQLCSKCTVERKRFTGGIWIYTSKTCVYSDKPLKCDHVRVGG